uniref:Uncharacterized protein n=1 Tax=Arundo donax TaxID=35708 RepID=A0A0A8YL10_ARUDO
MRYFLLKFSFNKETITKIGVWNLIW